MKDIRIEKLRREIDEVDSQILQLLAKRIASVKKIGEHKKLHNIPPLDETRWQVVLRTKMQMGEKLGLNTAFIKEVYEVIHKYSLEIESKS